MSLFSRPVRRQRWMRLTLATLIISAATVLGLAASSLSAVAQPAGPAPGCGQPGGQTGNAACLTVPPAAGYIPRGSTSGLDTIDGTSGVPLGGVGAGSVKFWPTRGTFSAVETTPADVNDYQTLPGAAFQLYTDRAGNVQANSQLKALSADGRSADQAIFPEQLANLGSLNGVEVGLTAFSPFDRGNVNEMANPYGFFQMTLTNQSSSPVTAALGLRLGNGSGAQVSSVPGQGFTTTSSGVERGVFAAPGSGAASSQPEVLVGASQGFLTSGTPGGGAGSGDNITAVRAVLQPHQEQTVRFVYAWYDHNDPSHYYYSNHFTDAAAVAQHGLAVFNTLYGDAADFVREMESSNIPSWLTTYITNTLANLPINGVYTQDGRLAFAEGCCGNTGTWDQMWAANDVISEFFPSLAYQELRYWACTQQADGQIHHDVANSGLGGPSDLVPCGDTNYGGEGSAGNWVDLNAGFIISFYETYIAAPDSAQFDYLWPHVEAAAQRILAQVAQYGDPTYPYTFDNTGCTYDAGGDCNIYNAGLSADAYQVMVRLAKMKGDSGMERTYATAFSTVNRSFTMRYLTNDFPASTSQYYEQTMAGQWVAYFLNFGQLYPTKAIDYAIGKLNQFYEPLVNGMGSASGWATWETYLIGHYGGLLEETGQESAFECLALDMASRNYLNRGLVYNQSLGLAPLINSLEPSTSTSVTQNYISLPIIWDDYFSLAGYQRNAVTGQVWLKPHVLPGMGHHLTSAFYGSPEGDGTVSYDQSGNAYQNERITLKPDKAIHVSTLYVPDTASTTPGVTLNGHPVQFQRVGEGHARLIAIGLNSQVGPDGLTVSVTYAHSTGAPATVSSAPVCMGGPTPLTRSGWTATASSGATPGAALDGDLGTSWTTGIPQAGGQWFEVDMGKPTTFDQVTLDVGANTNGYPREYQLYVSSDGTNWGQPVASGWGAPVTTISFGTVTARYFKVVRDEGNDVSQPWSIAEVNVLDGNLPRGGWQATAASGDPGRALDSNKSTAWITPGGQRPGQWFEVDFGRPTSINSLTLDTGALASDYPRGFQLYVSANGTDWGTPVASGTGSAVTTIKIPTQDVQYVKVVDTGSDHYPWAIAEILASGTQGRPNGWSAIASQGEDPNLAIDGLLGTRWTTDAPQSPGQWFAVNLGKPTQVSQVVLNTGPSPTDYPQGFQLYVSSDGINWGQPIASGAGSAVTTINIPTQTVQYIKIVQTGTTSFYWWSIAELDVS